MEKRIVGIAASIVMSSITLVAIIGSTDLSHYQSESLRYNINTECQVYAESVNCDVGSAIARRNDTNSEKI